MSLQVDDIVLCQLGFADRIGTIMELPKGESAIVQIWSLGAEDHLKTMRADKAPRLRVPMGNMTKIGQEYDMPKSLGDMNDDEFLANLGIT